MVMMRSEPLHRVLYLSSKGETVVLKTLSRHERQGSGAIRERCCAAVQIGFYIYMLLVMQPSALVLIYSYHSKQPRKRVHLFA